MADRAVGTFYCAVCERTLYRGADETEFCPVCSSPLVEVDAEAEDPIVIQESNPAAAS
jgi:uncharacterized Zn finger protein (UPF0148 family)